MSSSFVGLLPYLNILYTVVAEYLKPLVPEAAIGPISEPVQSASYTCNLSQDVPRC